MQNLFVECHLSPFQFEFSITIYYISKLIDQILDCEMIIKFPISLPNPVYSIFNHHLIPFMLYKYVQLFVNLFRTKLYDFHLFLVSPLIPT